MNFTALEIYFGVVALTLGLFLIKTKLIINDRSGIKDFDEGVLTMFELATWFGVLVVVSVIESMVFWVWSLR